MAVKARMPPIQGINFWLPPRLAMSRGCGSDGAIDPATKNSRPVMNPWATMPMIAALKPMSVIVAIPSITKPMCPTDEKAMSRFTSVWARQANDP